MVKLVNRAKMTTATTGTGTITLGAASGGFQTLAAAGVADGDTVRYVIEEGTAFELGSGVFSSAGGTLTRNPSESSAGGGAITLAGSALVFVTAASTDIQQPPAEGPFVDGDKTKLNGIAAGAQVNVATNLGYTTGASTGIVTSSTGTNATLPAATTSVAGLLTGADKTKLNGIAAGAQVNVATNLGYTSAASAGTVTSSTGTNATLPAATTSVAGLLTGADKTKLDGIAAGAQVNVATNLSYTGAATTGTVASSTGTNATLPAATTTVAGLLTGADKTKLDGIAAGAQVNVPTNLGQGGSGNSRTITSSTGSNVTVSTATTSNAGFMSTGDKTKLDGIAAGAQVNVATNLSITNGTTAGPRINSSTGANVFFPTASGTISGAVTTGNQTWAGTKTFSAAVVLSTAGTATTHAVRADRNIATGTGLSGGGNLTANRTLSITNGGVGTTQLAAGERMTTANVGGATAGLAVGAIGTYAFLVSNATDTRTLVPGSTVLGSSVRFGGVNRFGAFAVSANNVSVENGSETGLNINTAVTVVGTWRMMGNPRAFDANRGFGTIALRIA